MGEEAEPLEASPPAADDDAEGAPVGPSAAEEAALLAEEDGVPSPARTEPTVVEVPLPPLEDLVARVPEATRRQLEELFRARYVRVRRAPPGVHR